MSAGKRFFTHHSKSSAMVVSLVLHAVLAVVALSFVAVTVITKNDQKFEAKQVVRPRMPMKKLQVPVKIKRQKRRPRLRQRIVVKHKVRNMPDIKMPEISGDDVCRVLKQKYHTKLIPIVLFSTLEEKELAALAERAGADGFVSKNSGVEEIVKRIRELTGEILF